VQEEPFQSLYLEGGGNGIYFSLNYDLKASNNFGFRFGISGIPAWPQTSHTQRERNLNILGESPYFFSVLMGNYFIERERKYLELGAGLLLGEILDNDEWNRPGPSAATFTIGYRYFNERRWHPTFKAGLTPMIDFNGNAYLRFGISVGIMLSGDRD